MKTTTFPLSCAQMALYLQFQQNPNNTSYNIPVKIKLPNTIDVNKINCAINELAKKHAMLSAIIQLNEQQQPVNIIAPTEFTVSVIAKEQDLHALLNIPFKLDGEPLIRFYLQQSGDHSLLFIVHHHILTDYIPVSIVGELLKIAEQDPHSSAFESPLAAPMYENFVNHEQQYLSSEHAHADLNYWKSIMNSVDVIDINALPGSANSEMTGHSAVELNIDEDIYTKLQQRARELGVSMNAIFTTTLFLLLHEYTEQRHVAIATICNNRVYGGNLNTLGDYSNLVLLTKEITDEPLAKCIQSTWKHIIATLKHGRYPYYELIKNIDNAKDYFQIALVHHDFKSNADIEFEFDICQLPDHPIMFEMIEMKNRAIAIIKYNQSLFTKDNIDIIAKHYTRILENIVAQPQLSCSELNLLTDEEQSVLIQHSRSQCMQSQSSIATLHELFEQQVLNRINHIAIIQGIHCITYADINKQANQLANHIKNEYQHQFGCELQPDTVIAVYINRGIEAVIAMLAILKAGAAYLPLEITNPIERLQSIITDSQTRILITNQNVSNAARIFSSGMLIHLQADSEKILSYPCTNLVNTTTSRNAAYIIYTSGTTGKPNGAVLSHAGVCNLAVEQGAAFGISAGTRVLQFSSLAFDASVSEIWCTLILGGCLVFPANQHPLVGDDLTSFIQDNAIEVATIPPSVLLTMKPPSTLLLKTLVVAGEASSKALLDLWVDKADKLFNAYGPTEATVCATMHQYQQSDIATNIGNPLPGVNVFVLNKRLKLNSIGITGEIYISGMGVAKGYLHNPALNAAKFINHTLCEPGTKLYRTGDKGRYLKDGSIEYRGRCDNQIKIRGFRVELDEIEYHISQNKLIKQVAVSINRNEDEAEIIAFLVPHDFNIDIQSLKDRLIATLPAYMVPARFELMTELPRTTNGKVDKKKLLLNQNSKPVDNSTASTSIIEDESARTFIAICAEILKTDANLIDMNVHFLNQGGTSLSILKLISRVKRSFNVSLSIQSVFEANSLNDVFHLIQSDRKPVAANNDITPDTDIKTILRVNDDGIKPVSDKPQAILLTGATGFLGIHLLIKLLKLTSAKIVCLVRESSESAALNRLKHAYEQYGSEDWPADRISILLGDIAKPELGMTKHAFNEMTLQIDSVYHCAAAVNHLYTYSMLRACNVQSTIEIIKFCMHKKIKKIHYVSTIDTVTAGSESFDSESAPLPECGVNWGYIQSKWASEMILSNTDIPTAVYRPGNITGDSVTGRSLPDKNHALLLLKSCIDSGVAPDLNSHMEMTPVDLLSEAIVSLSLLPNTTLHAYYNLHHPVSLSWRDYLKIVSDNGYPLHIIAFSKWKNEILAKLDDNDPLTPFRKIYEEDEASKLSLLPEQIKTSKVQGLLAQMNVNFVIDYEALVKLYLCYLSNIGFINKKSEKAA